MGQSPLQEMGMYAKSVTARTGTSLRATEAETEADMSDKRFCLLDYGNGAE